MERCHHDEEIGDTFATKEDLDQLLKIIKNDPRWLRDAYEGLTHNCHTFVNFLLRVLDVQGCGGVNDSALGCVQLARKYTAAPKVGKWLCGVGDGRLRFSSS